MLIRIINGISTSGKTSKMITNYIQEKLENINTYCFLNKNLYEKFDMSYGLWTSRNLEIFVKYDFLLNEDEIIEKIDLLINNNENLINLYFDEFYNYSNKLLNKFLNFKDKKNIKINISNTSKNQLNFFDENMINYSLDLLTTKCLNCNDLAIKICPRYTDFSNEVYCNFCYEKKKNRNN